MRKKASTLVLSMMIFLFILTPAAKADVLGIDVSRWQGQIDWEAAKGSFGFVMIKAGGSDDGFYTDAHFSHNRDEARRLGIAHGFYYYVGGGNPYEEAQHFASIVGGLRQGEVLALDFEVDHPDPVGYSWTFLVRTEQLLKTKPLFYTNMSRVWSYDWRPVVEHGNYLWGAIYDDDPLAPPPSGAWSGVAIKQFTDEGVLPGIPANNVDVDYFGGSPTDFQTMGYQPPADEPADESGEAAEPGKSEDPAPGSDRKAQDQKEVSLGMGWLADPFGISPDPETRKQGFDPKKPAGAIGKAVYSIVDDIIFGRSDDSQKVDGSGSRAAGAAPTGNSSGDSSEKGDSAGWR